MYKEIGAQLYTVRDFCKTEEDFAQTIKRLSDIGYKVVQLSAIGDIDPVKIKEICDKYGMRIACTHRGFNEYTESFDFVVDFHKKCGCTVAGLGGLPGWDTVKTREQVMTVIGQLNEISRKLKKEGLRFAYHNHALEFAKVDGRLMIDYFLEYGEFGFILDVYWLAVAGIDPAKFIREHKDRVIMLHYKDLKVVSNSPAFCEVMEGNLDWDDIIAASFESGAEFALVEQDDCGGADPFLCMSTSYNNLKAKGFN